MDIKLEVIDDGITIDALVSMARIKGNIDDAQYALDSQIMTDMVPLMPMITGSFINLTRARSAALAGSGYVVAAAPPYGRFLYKGKTMVDELTGSTYARKAAKKVLVSEFSGKTKAKEDLKYSKTAHPQAQAEWFEKAKEKHMAEWLEKAKKAAEKP